MKLFETFIGKKVTLFFFFILANAESMTYVMYKVSRILWIFRKEKKRNNFADNSIFFVWSEESSEEPSKYSFGLGLVISFDIFLGEYE